nr:glycoside hydrolase family 9 protein [Lachnospiraceae bacterium]
AKEQLNYVLGKNSTSYCFVTGYGSLSPKNPHHRPSEVKEKAYKGMIVGGANSNKEDPYAKATMDGVANAKCYADNVQSYSCNEVTIYWNSPLVYMLSNYVNK